MAIIPNKVKKMAINSIFKFSLFRIFALAYGHHFANSMRRQFGHRDHLDLTLRISLLQSSKDSLSLYSMTFVVEEN
jgi:hypothetical protein